jgi:hypothetical protein
LSAAITVLLPYWEREREREREREPDRQREGKGGRGKKREIPGVEGRKKGERGGGSSERACN